jgi:F0F1-type ATP synthase membrane subunit a
MTEPAPAREVVPDPSARAEVAAASAMVVDGAARAYRPIAARQYLWIAGAAIVLLVVDRFDDLVPRRWQALVQTIVQQIDEVLAEFLRGQLSVMLVLAVYYAIALSLLVGLRHPRAAYVASPLYRDD